MSKIQILPTFFPLLEIAQRKEIYKNVDTIIVTGGRNSFKSFHISLLITMLTVDYNWKTLYTRYTWKSAKDSVIEEIGEKVNLLNFQGRVKITIDRIIKKTKTKKDDTPEIVFKGIKTNAGNQTAILKSLKGFNCFVMEEGEEHPDYKDWRKIYRSIRHQIKPNISIIILNPTTREHWIYDEFFRKVSVKEGFNGIKENVCYIHSIYTNKLKWVPRNIQADFEKTKKNYTKTEIEELSKKESVKLQNNGIFIDRITNKELYSEDYNHTIVGGFRLKAEGVIFKFWEYGKFPEYCNFKYGQDFGVADPDAFVRSFFDKYTNTLYIEELLYINDLGTDDLIKKLKPIIIQYGRKIIKADNAAAREIKDLKKAGLYIRPCKKGPGSVLAGIKKIKSFRLVVCGNSQNLVNELNNYVWSDKKQEIPIDKYNHLLDAVRYSQDDLINSKGGQWAQS